MMLDTFVKGLYEDNGVDTAVRYSHKHFRNRRKGDARGEMNTLSRLTHTIYRMISTVCGKEDS